MRAAVRALLWDAKVALKLSNCFSLTARCHVWTTRSARENTAADNKNCEAVRTSLSRTYQMKLRFFMEMCNVYHRLVLYSALVAAPLSARTGKCQSFVLELNVVGLPVFQELKRRLTSPPIPALPRRGQRYILNMDPCD